MFSLAACGGEETKEKASSTSSSEKNTESSTLEEAEFKFENNQVEMNDLKIVITDYKILQVGETGNEYGDKPVIAFWYDTTNKTDKELDPTTSWIATFSAVQDNNPDVVNELKISSLPDQQFLDTQVANIKKDGTLSNAVAYELSDSETPVTLIATQGILGDELGRQDYTIK